MSTRRIVFLNSAYEGAPRALADRRLDVIEEEQLPQLAAASVHGLIISSHVDQIWLAGQADWLKTCLDTGGRIFFNGHVEAHFIAGLDRYRALKDRSVTAFKVERRVEHPIWSGYDGDVLTFRKGVAGFYGRGHNPMPQGAVAINLLDAAKEAAPVDWEWARPQGGRVISHAGNDLWTTFEDLPRNTEICTRMVAWLEAA